MDPAMPVKNKMGSILNNSRKVQIEVGALSTCHVIPCIHSSNCSSKTAYPGQIDGIKMTGRSHIPRSFNLLFFPVFLALLYIRMRMSGINTSAEIFVNTAKPKKMPESETVNNRFVFSKTFLQVLL